MIKYTINTKYKSSFDNFFLAIKKYFNNNNNSIHKARNELKVIDYNGISTVVKSFKVLNIIRKLVYTYFRQSKAKKSYDYSLRLKDFTPTPIGYIEFYRYRLLDNSYFVSEKFEYDFTIREPLLNNGFNDKDNILKQFASFTYDLHQDNILHQDYSPGNILIKKDKNNNYIFKVVDINRMQFKSLSLKQRLKNFNKLWANDKDLTIIIKEYAKLLNEDKDICLKLALKYNQKHKNKINMKKRLKGVKVVD